MTKQISDHAAAAKQIRQELKKHGVQGSVRAATASMTTSVNVTLDGVAPWVMQAVLDFANKYQYGHFDGMTDSYEYSNKRDDLPQVKFVFVDNRFTDEQEEEAYQFLRKNQQEFENAPKIYKKAQNFYAKGCGHYAPTLVRMVLRQYDFYSDGPYFWAKLRVKGLYCSR